MNHRKLTLLISAVAITILVCVIIASHRYPAGAPDDAKTETPTARLGRLRKSADAALSKAITHDLIGYQRTINQHCLAHDEDWKKWVGSATAEFVNRVGGVERTNLYWKFKPSGQEVYAVLITQNDYIAMLNAKPQ